MLVFDYNRAMAQVRELRSIADGMEKNPRLAEAMDKVRSGWEGQSSKDFQSKIAQLQELVTNEVKHIRDIANGLEQSAKNIAEAERLAKERLAANSSGQS